MKTSEQVISRAVVWILSSPVQNHLLCELLVIRRDVPDCQIRIVLVTCFEACYPAVLPEFVALAIDGRLRDEPCNASARFIALMIDCSEQVRIQLCQSFLAK